MTWSPPAIQRYEALSEYLSELGLDHSQQARTVPDQLTFHGQTLSLDAWERGILQISLGRNPDAAPEWAPLLAEGLAYHVKFLTRYRNIGLAVEEEVVEPNENGGGNSEQLILDTAVGLALLQELQHAIDESVVRGDLTEAKKLTGFRNRINPCVGELKDLLDPDDSERAHNRAQGMVAPPQERVGRSTGPAPKGAGGVASLPAKKRRKRQQRAAAASAGAAATAAAVAAAMPEGTTAVGNEPRKSKVPLLFGVLFVALLAWAILILPRMFDQPAYVMTQADLSEVPGVYSVMARPPSVYVEVEDSEWNRLSLGERTALVDSIGAAADDVGYNGAYVKKAYNGAAVALWLRDEGVRLIEESR